MIQQANMQYRESANPKKDVWLKKKKERRQPLSGTQKGILVQVYRYLKENRTL